MADQDVTDQTLRRSESYVRPIPSGDFLPERIEKPEIAAQYRVRVTQRRNALSGVMTESSIHLGPNENDA
jgi:hypothetical protein